MAKRRPPPKRDDKSKPKRRPTPSRAVTSAELETHTEPVATPGPAAPSPGENVTVVFDVGEAMGWAGGGSVDAPSGKRSRKPGGDK